MSSSSSTDAPPGFEIGAAIGRGPRGTVYVATQSGLGRRVALKLYRSPERTAPWPEHPGVARLHAAGTTPHGSYTASQLAPGGSLAARLAAGDIRREEALALCDQVERTLAEVDRPHGALSAGNVLIGADGRALLCDFGMPGVRAGRDADARALAQLRERCTQLPPSRAHRRVWAIAAAVVVPAVALGAVALRDDDTATGPPAALPGAVVLGSPLSGGRPSTLGCGGRSPDGSSPTCTVAVLRRGGRPAAFPRDGVVRRWLVRGARGSLTLQVIRARGRGRYVVVARSWPQTASASAIHAFAADLPVRRGDLVGLGLAPGAGVGAVPRAGDATARFVGALSFSPPQAPVPASGTALDSGLELRVDYVPGARPRPVPELVGPAARAAPAGRRIATGEVELPGGGARTLVLVATGDRVALDLLRDGRRLHRVDVVGADPRGRLDVFDRFASTAIGPYIVWRNPDGGVVTHDYRVGATRLVPVD